MTDIVEALEKLYVATRRFNAPECDALRWDAVKKEWYCAFRLTRRDKENYVCAYDDVDAQSMRDDEIICPCWQSIDEE